MRILKEVKGTAGEAYQMYHYNQMVETYGEDTALGMMKPSLERVGLSVSQFQNYLDVKQAIQNGSLKVTEAKANAEKLVSNAISEVLA